MLHIEETAGWRESALHWLMLLELGAGLAAVLLLAVNALVISIFAAACVLHEATMLIDLGYASARRRIPPIEQWVHGVQQAIPWVVLLVLCALEPGQALGLIGMGDESARFELRFAPLPLSYLSGFVASAILLVALPYVLELRRALARVPALGRA
jgi:hypothetical protein